jgi:NarL family two-component system response regulator LiaR
MTPLDASSCSTAGIRSYRGTTSLIHAVEEPAPLWMHGCGVSCSRVILVADQQMFTEAVAAELAAHPDFWVLGRYTTDDPRLGEVAMRGQPEVIVIDVEPLGSAAADVVSTLRAAAPGVHVVVLTAVEDPAVTVAVARAGADAWVDMDTTLEHLVDVIRSVIRGQAWYPSPLLGVVLRELRADVGRARQRTGPLDVLSRREREVLLGMVHGKSGTQIAVEMFLSANTVRTHSRSILTKLQVHSRLEAVAVARAAGLRPSGRETVSSPDPSERGSRSHPAV